MSGLFATILIVGLLSVSPVQAADHWGFGTDLGFLSGTTNGTVFSLGMNLDYYVDPAFSFGPMVIFTPVGDLTQVAVAGVARYHFRTGRLNIVPFAGVGFVHADLDRGAGAGRINRNDTSHYIPLGVTVEYPLTPKLAFATTVMVNLHDIKLDPPVERDRTSVGVLFGIRFGP
jgi:hypothetical protein